MPGDGRRGALATAFRGLTVVLQVALVGLLVAALVRAEAGLAINAGMALAVALVPVAVRRRYGVRLNAVLAAWIAIAAVLHAVGAMGAYQAFPWFDQIAHGVSASLVAGAGYAFVRVVEETSTGVEVPPSLRFAFILIFATSFGVAWEIAEFGLELAATATGGDPLLTQYGLDDVVMDLLFDLGGAVVVALWGTSYFAGVRRVFALSVD